MLSASKETLVVPPSAKSLPLNWPLVLIVTLTLLRGLLYLSIFPPFLAPDESAHFEAIRLIGQEKKWPTAEVYMVTPMHPEMIATFDKFRIWSLVDLYSPTRNLAVTSNLFIDYYPTQIAGSEVVASSYLMLYHLTLAPLAAITASFDLVTQVYILRFVSVLFATLTVSVAWFTMRVVFPAEPALAVAVTVLITFWPMHTHVTASITVDALAEMLTSTFFLVLVTIWLKGFSKILAVVLLGLMVLALLTKPTTFFIWPTLAAAVVIHLSRRLNFAHFIRRGLLTLLLGFTFVGSLWLHENSTGGRNLGALFSDVPIWLDGSKYITWESLRYYLSSLNFAVLSFGGLFGWSNIHLPWAWVRILAGFCLLLILGILLFIYQHIFKPTYTNNELTSQQRDLLNIFLFALIFAFIGVATPIIATQSPSWGIHSRYYFPVIIPFALYFFFGFRQLIPKTYQTLALPGWVIAWIAYDNLILIWVVLPYLYG